MDRRDPYRILGVLPEADPDVIRAAYRVLARKLHPDSQAGPMDPVTDRRIKDLNWAYAQVRDPESQLRFSQTRAAAAPPTSAEPRSHGTAHRDAEYDATRAKLDFGRYAGWTLRDVAQRDIEYVQWLRRHASGARYRPAIDQLLVERRKTTQR
ncbi:MAG: DnaJ domain-containing protein [Chloroflexota bacterium]